MKTQGSRVNLANRWSDVQSQHFTIVVKQYGEQLAKVWQRRDEERNVMLLCGNLSKK
jgi:hypothetical protein